MKITEKELERLAKVSRFRIESGKTAEFLRDLNLFLAAAESVVDFSAPADTAFLVVNSFREDVPAQKENLEKLMSAAAEKDGCYFVVPNVVD